MTTTPVLPMAAEVPDFASDDEASEWYATHDLSLLPMEEVPLPRRGKLVTVAVRLPERELEEIKARADRLGIGYTTYIRMLVNRHVRKTATRTASPPRT